MLQAKTQQRLEATLASYVGMPTVTTNIEACDLAMREIAAEYENLGMTVHLDGPIHPWLIATTTQTAMITKRVKVLFVVHFDVVPPENDAQRTLKITKDKLYGRGVFDMKFAAAAVKEMLVDFSKDGALTDYDFGILLTTDEEKGGYDGALEFLKHGWRCDIAIVPDGGYNWAVEKRAKGLTYIYLTAYGRSAHSSRPWLGDNPVNKLAPALTEITSQFTNDDHLGLVVCVNNIESSNSTVVKTTQTAKWARAGISVRAFTDEEAHQAAAFIDTIAKKYGVVAETVLNESGVQLYEKNPLVQKFITLASEVHGQPIEFFDGLGASDARHFYQFNIPSVQMYPNGGDHHGPNEWIVRDDLYKYYLLCKRYVKQTAALSKMPASTVASGRH